MESTTETKRYRLNNKNCATWATMMRAEMCGLGCLPLIKQEPVEGVSEKNMKLYIHQMLALGEFIDLEFKEKFKLKKTDKVAMVNQQQPTKLTGKCYNCDIIGHLAKECRKPWTKKNSAMNGIMSANNVMASGDEIILDSGASLTLTLLLFAMYTTSPLCRTA